MPLTLSYGYTKPVSGDESSLQWMIDLAANMQKLNDHTHDGSNSAVISTTVQAPVAISALSIDWSAGSIFTKSITAPSTFTFANTVSGKTLVVIISNTAGTVTWPAGIKWPRGITPVQSLNATDVYTFINVGSDYYGFHTPNPTATANVPITPAALDIDWAAGEIFIKSISGNETFTFSNLINGKTILVRMTQTGAYSPTWPAGIKWPGGVVPTATSTAVDLYSFTNIGGTIYGAQSVDVK